MSFKHRIDRLEQAARPAAAYEICMNLSSADFAIWSGAGGLDAYLDLMSAAGLMWLRDDERIISWLIDIGDGARFESQPPVVRRARYTPPRGWPKSATIKIWDLSTQPGRPGRHVRELEQPPGDPWPAHWPLPRLPLSPAQEASGE